MTISTLTSQSDRETRPRMIEAQTEIPAAQVLSRNQAYINSLLSQAERLVSSLSPETMRDLIEKKATNHMKANQRFISADDHSKAKIIVLNMLRVLHATQLAVQAQQLAQVQYTLARPEPDKSFK